MSLTLCPTPRPLSRLVMGLLGGLIALTLTGPAIATDDGVKCPSDKARPVYETTDRCRANYIDLRIERRQWTTIKEGRPFCFRPKETLWEWKCRGYTEATRCRGSKSKRAGRPLVRVEVEGGEVRWSCFAN